MRPRDNQSWQELASILRERRRDVGVRIAILAAHPDDETLGASLLLQRAARCSLVHLTDGAPRDPALRSLASAGTRVGYAHARRLELLAALAQSSMAAHRATWLGAVDQEACFALPGLVRRLVLEDAPDLARRPEQERGDVDTRLRRDQEPLEPGIAEIDAGRRGRRREAEDRVQGDPGRRGREVAGHG